MKGMARTGLILGGLGGILVTLLAFINNYTKPIIEQAQESVEKRERQNVFPSVKDNPNLAFSPQSVYILEKKYENGYKIFSEIVKLPNFEKLSQTPSIEFIVLKTDEKVLIQDRQNLKYNPIYITEDQFNALKLRFKEARVKLVSYHEAYEKAKDENGKDANRLNGWVVKFYAKNGYAGNIGMLIGYDVNGKVTGYKMVDHSETPGLGVKANDKNFVQGFIGKSPLNMPLEKKDYKPKLGIDSISGATITSLAVSHGVKEGYEILRVNRDGELENQVPIPVNPSISPEEAQKAADTKKALEEKLAKEAKEAEDAKKALEAKEALEKKKAAEERARLKAKQQQQQQQHQQYNPVPRPPKPPEEEKPEDPFDRLFRNG